MLAERMLQHTYYIPREIFDTLYTEAGRVQYNIMYSAHNNA